MEVFISWCSDWIGSKETFILELWFRILGVLVPYCLIFTGLDPKSICISFSSLGRSSLNLRLIACFGWKTRVHGFEYHQADRCLPYYLIFTGLDPKSICISIGRSCSNFKTCLFCFGWKTSVYGYEYQVDRYLLSKIY